MFVAGLGAGLGTGFAGMTARQIFIFCLTADLRSHTAGVVIHRETTMEKM